MILFYNYDFVNSNDSLTSKMSTFLSICRCKFVGEMFLNEDAKKFLCKKDKMQMENVA